MISSLKKYFLGEKKQILLKRFRWFNQLKEKKRKDLLITIDFDENLINLNFFKKNKSIWIFVESLKKGKGFILSA